MQPTSHHVGFDQARLQRLNQWMQRYIEAGKFAGSSVLIYRNGREVFFNAAGMRNCESGQRFERDTVVRLYSMTKPVTTVALMLLVEKGLCHLDAQVSDFIPAFTDMQALVPGATSLDQTVSCAPPTLHQLLTHTSGLSYGFNPGLLSTDMKERKLDFHPSESSLEEVCVRLAELPLCFQPGMGWEYSVSIDVIGRVIEVISGQSLDQYFQTEIFEPLGINDIGFNFTDSMKGRIASLYSSLSGDPMDLNAAQKGKNAAQHDRPQLRLVDEETGSPFWETRLFSGGGGLVGTLDAYMRFAEALRTGKTSNGAWLLSPQTLAFMKRNHLRGDIASLGPKSFAEQPMEGVGFGLGGAVILDPARARTPGHVGDFSWGGMASTFFWIDHSFDMSVVFLTQLTPSSSYPARAELKAIVNGAMNA
ncbi:MAG: serine hydrolase domain-containing protein [Paracoccaceae bacterium]